MLVKIFSSHYAQFLNGWSDGNKVNGRMASIHIPDDIWLLDKDERQEKMDSILSKITERYRHLQYNKASTIFD